MPIALLVPWVVLLVACTGEPGRATPRPAIAPSASTAGRSASARPPPAPSGKSTRPPPPLPDGCYNGVFVNELSATTAVETLASRCSQGMSAVLTAVYTARVQRGNVLSIAFQVDDPARCFRVVAAAPGTNDIAVEISDGKASIAKDELLAPFALLGPRGPICFASSGRYWVNVRVPDADALAAVQVYCAD